MGDEPTPSAFEDLDKRLKQARDVQEAATPEAKARRKAPMTGFGAALRLGSELVAALLVGVGFGLLLDNWLETRPIFLVVFFFFGAAAGVLNVYRVANGDAFGAKKDDVPHGSGTKRTDPDG